MEQYRGIRTICINIVPEKQERKEKKLEEIIAKDFPNFMENSKPRISMNPEKEKQKPLGTLKINNKENTLKAVREATSHTQKNNKNKIDFVSNNADQVAIKCYL